MGLLGRQHPVGQDQFGGPFHAHRPRQEIGRRAVGRQTGPGVGHGKPGRLCGQDQIAGAGHAHARAGRYPVDHADQRRVHAQKARYRAVQIDGDLFEMGGQRRPASVGGKALEIPAGAEHAARAGQQHGPNVAVFAALDRGLHEFSGHVEVERVGVIGPLERNRGNLILHLKAYGCVVHPVLPQASSSATARPISRGESSCTKWVPLTVTSFWFGQLRQNSRCGPVRITPGSALTNSLGMGLVDSQAP